MNAALKAIINLLSQKPNGLSASDLLALSKKPLARRTLLRRLNTLIEQNLLLREGKGSEVIYKLVSIPELRGRSVSELSLSSVAIHIQSSVKAPLETRASVGYQQAFLNNYQPNHTFYLSQNERDHLSKLGAQKDGRQPAGTFARKILDRFLIDLTWNSSRLEGNTYSLLETEQLIHQGLVTTSKTPIETQMILNHKAAIEFLVEPNYEITFDKFTICNLHALLSDNLLKNPNACGRVRNIAVGIGGSAYRPLEIPQQIEDSLQEILNKASKINNVFEQSFFIMVHLPYLQPFEDVNKRVSRLSANIPFFNKNYCPISFVDVPEKNYIEGLLGVYELNRVELLKEVFIWAYERSTDRYAEIRQTVGEPDPFRLHYRDFSYEIIHQVVQEAMPKTQAINTIHLYAQSKISQEDRAHFIEMVETELLALHEGNFARYKITPNMFKAWKVLWQN
jgi:hypothetical protein